MIPFLSLLSNPITKLVADKVIGGAKHALEKKAMIREAEVEAIKQTDFAKIKKEEAIAKAQQAVMKEQVKASQNRPGPNSLSRTHPNKRNSRRLRVIFRNNPEQKEKLNPPHRRRV